jgi:hypothetical protein
MRRLIILIVVAASCTTPSHDDATEVARVREHFSAVIAELSSADTHHLDTSQREARGRVLERLQRYRDAGVFPHNHDFAAMTPYFIDLHGTRCAVAYLLDEDGESALVERVAAERNNSYVPELVNEPELVAWLDRSGLTVAEAARIQVVYVKSNTCSGAYAGCDRPWYDSTALEIAVGGLDAAAIALNARHDAAVASGAFGVATGLASAAIGFELLTEPGGQGDSTRGMIGSLEISAGIGVAIFGAYNLARDRPADARPKLSIAPTTRVPGLAVAGTF